MKCIKSFTAKSVYNTNDIEINFFEDLTFLYGLNGSGKTTALRLIMALLVPSLKTLIEIPFDNVELTGQLRNGDIVNVCCNKLNGNLILKTSLADNELIINSPKIDVDDLEMFLEREYRNNPVMISIRDVSSPIFLGLDRRFIAPSIKNHRAQFNSRQMAFEFEREKMIAEHHGYDAGIAEISSIILEFVRTLKARQQKADSSFRKQLLLDSFAYVDPQTHEFTGPPNEKMFSSFREKRKEILATLQKLDLASEEFEQTSETFFSKIEEIISNLNP